MAKNIQPAEQLPKARKLPADRLIIDDTRIAIAYQTESDAAIQQVELLAVNAETADEIRLPMNTHSRELGASGLTGTRWRNVSRISPQAIASTVSPGQWRCYLIVDAATQYRPSPPEGLLEEPIVVSVGLLDLKFYRSQIGLLVFDVESRKLNSAHDLTANIRTVSQDADHALQIAGTIELLGEPLSSTPCQVEIRAREGEKVLQSVSVTPDDGQFEVAVPASGLPFGIHDVFFCLPTAGAAVRMRAPEGLGGDQMDGAPSDTNGTVATAYRTQSGFLALFVAPAAAHFEISSIQATQTTFLIAGAVGNKSEVDRTARRVLNKYQCFAVGRDTGDEIELGVSFDEGTFHIKFAPQSLHDIDFGIWDIALKSPRGELCFLSQDPEKTEITGTSIVCSSVSGAAAAIECLTTTPDRIAVSVQPLLRKTRLERLAVGNTLSISFELQTRGVSVTSLFAGAKVALLVSFGAMPVHRMPGRAQFTPTGPFTCRVTLDCALGAVAPERLRKVIANCAVGIEFKGPNIDGTAPLDIDDSKIFTTGLRAAVEMPWTKVLSEKRGEQLYKSSGRREAQTDIALFTTRANEGYSGNAKAISQVLAQHAPQTQQVWVLDDPEQAVGHPGTAVRPGTAAYYNNLARARYIVGDADLPPFFEKRPGTIYLQTSIPTVNGEIAFDAAALGRWDIVLSPHAYATKRLKQMLGFSGEILEHGNPRNDILIDAAAREQIAARLRGEFAIHPNKQIILYAPERHDSRPPISLHSLQSAVGSDHVVLLRLPAGAANEFEWLGSFSGFAVNVSKFESLTDLMCVADIFVTDTSPAMVDFALTGKPMIFYMRDRVSLDPDFVDHAPGPIVRRQFSLTRVLQRMDAFSERFAGAYRTFVETYCAQEKGNAAEVAVKRLLAKSGVSGLR
jgi:CDP-glycerol glycerophosphotransferase (TagB/SpsB family)